MAYILAHDLGTTGNKANLFDETGVLVASHLESYSVDYPHIGWAEQNPDDWWRAVRDSTRALLQSANVDPRDIAAVTFSGQMMGVVALDANDRPLRSAIIWADVRAVEEANLIAGRCGAAEVYRRTGHRVSASYSAAKIVWIKRHQPDIYSHAQRFVLAKDYAALRLTDVAATDYSDASGTNFFDLRTRTWCRDFLDKLEIDESRLPRICASTDVIGQVTQAASDETGLAAGTPVVIGGGDGACATVGAGAVDIGDAYCVLGTSSWIAFTSQQPLFDPQQRTFTFHNLHPTLYMPTGTMQSACGARDWLIRATGDVAEDQIAAVPPGSNHLLFLPYLIGERSPWWNPQARAAFVGLTMNHSSAEMSRAVLEGVAMNLKIILDAFTSHTQFKSLRLIGGGARSKLWQHILADVFAVPIEIPELLAEATSWGAAVAGGIGVGLYPNWSVAKTQTKVREVIEPDRQNVACYAELSSLFADTYHALEPIYRRM